MTTKVRPTDRDAQREKDGGIPPKPRTDLERERQKKYDHARRDSPKRKEYGRNYSKKRYEERKNLGLCVECDERTKEGKTRCERHLNLLRESGRRRAAKKKAEKEQKKGK